MLEKPATVIIATNFNIRKISEYYPSVSRVNSAAATNYIVCGKFGNCDQFDWKISQKSLLVFFSVFNSNEWNK